MLTRFPSLLEGAGAVLAALRALRTLTLAPADDDHLGLLSPAMTAVTRLSLGCRSCKNLAPISALTALQHLKISDAQQLTSLAPLSALSAVTNLSLHSLGKGASSFEPVGAMEALEELRLSYCFYITDLSPLSALTNLHFLRVDGIKKLKLDTPVKLLVPSLWGWVLPSSTD
jgi:Leucine-rich repeat (LRR) protein